MKKYLFLLFSSVHSIHPLMTKIINFCSSKQTVVDSSLDDTLWRTIEDKDNNALQKLFIGNRIPDINCMRDDRTPLVYACANNCPEIVETLIHNGADIEKTDNKLHWTGLMWAAWMEHLPILQILYKAKANFNAQDKNGKTALMWATNYALKDDSEKIKIIEFLVVAGAETTIENGSNNNKRAIDYASIVTKSLIQDAIIRAQIKRQLIIAAQKKRTAQLSFRDSE